MLLETTGLARAMQYASAAICSHLVEDVSVAYMYIVKPVPCGLGVGVAAGRFACAALFVERCWLVCG